MVDFEQALRSALSKSLPGLNRRAARYPPAPTEEEEEILGEVCFLKTHCFNLPHLREQRDSVPGSSCRVVEYRFLYCCISYSYCCIYYFMKEQFKNLTNVCHSFFAAIASTFWEIAALVSTALESSALASSALAPTTLVSTALVSYARLQQIVN